MRRRKRSRTDQESAKRCAWRSTRGEVKGVRRLAELRHVSCVATVNGAATVAAVRKALGLRETNSGGARACVCLQCRRPYYVHQVEVGFCS